MNEEDRNKIQPDAESKAMMLVLGAMTGGMLSVLFVALPFMRMLDRTHFVQVALAMPVFWLIAHQILRRRSIRNAADPRYWDFAAVGAFFGFVILASS